MVCLKTVIIVFFYLLLFVAVVYLVFVVLCITLDPFYFCNRFDKEERAGCCFDWLLDVV